MVKQLLLPLAGVAAFIILVGLLVKNSGNISIPGLPTAPPTASPSATLQTKSIIIGNKIMQVEVADTQPARELGLGGRASLADNSGMLFVFDKKGVIETFWMKGMLIPLDIIWISGNKVVKIDKNIQPPNPNSDKPLATYTAGQPVDYVLEVNAGFSDKNSINVGSYFDFTENLK